MIWIPISRLSGMWYAVCRMSWEDTRVEARFRRVAQGAHARPDDQPRTAHPANADISTHLIFTIDYIQDTTPGIVEDL